jgi:r-opsin
MAHGPKLNLSNVKITIFYLYTRYNVIVKGFNGAPLTFSKAVMLITFTWIWAFGWAVCPLVGWGYYAMDGMLGT